MSSLPNSQQLLLVKDLFGEAQTLAAREDTFSTTKSILFLDLAVEQMMRAIIFTLKPNSNPRKDLKWHELWTEADGALQAKSLQLHNSAPLKALHEHRNMVQHTGATYHFSQARTYVVPVGDTLTHAFHDVYALEFARYNLLALIANDDLRRWLQDAEQILIEGGPMFTIAACNYAHRLVIHELKKQTGKDSHHWPTRVRSSRMDVRDYVAIAQAVQELDKRITEEIEALEQEVVAIGVGLSILEVRRFRAFGNLVPVSVYEDGQLEINYKDGTVDERKTAAAFMLDYLSRLIRSIDETYGSVLGNLKLKVPLMDQEIIKQAQSSPG